MAANGREERVDISRIQSSSGTSTTASSSTQPSTSSSKTAPNLLNKQLYIDKYTFPYCDDLSKYEKVTKIGQGTFGEVFKARHKNSNKKFVALKRVLMENEKEGVSTKVRFE